MTGLTWVPSWGSWAGAGWGQSRHWSGGSTSLSHTRCGIAFSQLVRLVTSLLVPGAHVSSQPLLQCSSLGGIDHLGTPRTCSGSGAEVQVEGGQAGEAFIFLCKPSPPSAHMFFSTSRDSILQSLSGLPSGAKRRADDSRTRHSLCHGCG